MPFCTAASFWQAASAAIRQTIPPIRRKIPMVSYLLNRAWTFQATHQRATFAQVAKFYVIALVGMLISVTVGSVVQRVVPAGDKVAWAVAAAAGTAAGFLWNFNGQRLWTFKHK